MVVPSITDGTTTIEFHSMDSFRPVLETKSLSIHAFKESTIQQVIDKGVKEVRYRFVFNLKKTTTKSAYEQLEELITLNYTKNATYDYQRKITIQKPDDSGSEDFNGKILSIDALADPDDIVIFEITIEFALDDLSKQIP